jgi:hypothetical protein
VDPAGTVSFELRASHGKLRVKSFAFSGIPIDCDSGPSTTSGVLDFARVKKQRFQALGIGKPLSGLEGSRLRIHGKLTQRRRHAVGTIRVFGPAPIEGGTGTNCHTGKRPWSADRG